MDPLVFTPYLRPAVWGGRRLEELNRRLPPGAWGESWEISVHPAHVSVVAEGPFTGMRLDELCRAHGEALFGRGSVPATFPLLFKYLDAADWLSVQVHPNDEQAPRLAQELAGKTEAWVVLDVTPEGRILAGLRPGVGPAEFERALHAGCVAECLHEIRPQPGECYYLPAGTVHALGKGVLLAEVQQSSDATLRLHDWGRMGSDGKPRPLHVAEGLEAIDWSAGPVKAVTGQGSRLVECEYFVIDRYQVQGELVSPWSGRLSVWMVLEGAVTLHTEAGHRRECRRGDTVLVPAAALGVGWEAREATLLAVTVPEGK